MKRAPSIPKPDKEVVLLAANLTNNEARFLVSNYYAAQKARKAEDMQKRHLGDNPEGAIIRTLDWCANAHADIEKAVLRSLTVYAEAHAVGRWMLAQYGIGPVITAGFLAHLDIERAPTAGHFWSFSNLNPEQKWEKGQKRPYNPDMKQLCYHLGECVKRTSNAADSIYGKIYRQRKALLVARNDRGFNAERAKTFVTKSAEVRKTLAEGKLPDGNIDRQACNYVAKIFLSHLHAVMFWEKYGRAPLPYSLAMLNHEHFIDIPHVNMFPGLQEHLHAAARTKKAA